MKARLRPWTIAAGFAVLSAAQAGVEIGFESAQGYSTTGGTAGGGDLAGQPASGSGAKWGNSGQSAAKLVVSTEAVHSGEQAVKALNVGNFVDSRFAFYPNSSDWGGTVPNRTAGNEDAATLQFRLQVRYGAVENAAAADQGKSALVYAMGQLSGGAPNARLYFRPNDNGRATYSFLAGGSVVTRYALDANGGDFKATAGTWYEVVANLDYAARTYRLWVNGVAQTDSADGLDLGFERDGGASTEGVRLTAAGSYGKYKAMYVDSLSIAVFTPPPSGTVVLLR